MAHYQKPHLKIVVMGAPGVGKTAFVVRYLTKRFIGEYYSNEDHIYSHKSVIGKDEYNIDVLDTAWNSMKVLQEHIEWADGCLLIFSMTDKSSFDQLYSLKAYIDDIKPRMPIVLVANKTDLLIGRELTEEQCLQIADIFHCPMKMISVAEDSLGVQRAMHALLTVLKHDSNKHLSLDRGSKIMKVKDVLMRRLQRSRSDTV